MTPWTVAHQSPLPMEFSRQEHWSGLPFPSPENLSGLNPALNLGLLHCRQVLYHLNHHSLSNSLIHRQDDQSDCLLVLHFQTLCKRFIHWFRTWKEFWNANSFSSIGFERLLYTGWAHYQINYLLKETAHSVTWGKFNSLWNPRSHLVIWIIY